MESTTAQKLGAELLGTFAIVFFGVGTALMWRGDPLITALAFGLSLTVMVYGFGRVSGGHFNPAVSVGMALGGRIAWRQVPAYVGAQVVGSVLAAALLFALKQGGPAFDATGHFGQNAFGTQSGWAGWSVFLLELVMTAFFVLVWLAVTDGRNDASTGVAPLAVGLTYALLHMASLSADGTSVNPARSIGPALFAGVDSISQLWLFILAPLLGGVLAGLAYPAVFGHGEDPVVGSGRPRRRRGATAAYDPYAQPWPPRAARRGRVDARADRHLAAAARLRVDADARVAEPVGARGNRPGADADQGVVRSSLAPGKGCEETSPLPAVKYSLVRTPGVSRLVTSSTSTSRKSPAGTSRSWWTAYTRMTSSATPSAYSPRQPSPSRGLAGIASPASAPSSPARHERCGSLSPKSQTLPARSCAT